MSMSSTKKPGKGGCWQLSGGEDDVHLAACPPLPTHFYIHTDHRPLLWLLTARGGFCLSMDGIRTAPMLAASVAAAAVGVQCICDL